MKELQQLNVWVEYARYSQSKYWVADFRSQKWIFSHKDVVLVAVEERHEGLQKRLSRNEVAELTEVELIRLIHVQLGTPGSRSVNSRVYESKGSPRSVVLLLGRERTDIRPSCSKNAEEEVVWQAFTEFDMPEKVIRAEWDSSSPSGENIWRDQRSK